MIPKSIKAQESLYVKLCIRPQHLGDLKAIFQKDRQKGSINLDYYVGVSLNFFSQTFSISYPLDALKTLLMSAELCRYVCMFSLF